MPGLIFLLAAMLSLGGGQAPPSDPVDTVRQLYAAADYEAALAALK